MFTVGEDMLRTATQSGARLAQRKVNAGWLMITAVASMGAAYVRYCGGVARLLSLWRASFPRSVEEARAETQRGDTFTWVTTLEARAG